MTILPKPRRYQFKKYKKCSPTSCVRACITLATTQPDKYEPEEIVGFQLKCGIELFLIKWKDWDHSENTWGGVGEFQYYPDVLNDYIKKQEREHFQDILKLIDEISGDNDLLSEQNLVDSIPDARGLDFKVLYQQLIIKYLAIKHLNLRERRHENRLIREAQCLLQLCVTRKRCLRMETLRNQFNTDEEFLAHFGFKYKENILHH